MESHIKFNCSDCGFRVKTPMINAGKKGKCPHCKVSSIIPEENIDLKKDLEKLDEIWERIGKKNEN